MIKGEYMIMFTWTLVLCWVIVSFIWWQKYEVEYRHTVNLRQQAAELAMENYELKVALRECQEASHE